MHHKCSVHTTVDSRCTQYTYKNPTTNQSVPITLLYKLEVIKVGCAHFCFYSVEENVTRWTFNVERDPWWGGVFERLIRSVKRCLRKVVGRAKLTREE